MRLPVNTGIFLTEIVALVKTVNHYMSEGKQGTKVIYE